MRPVELGDVVLQLEPPEAGRYHAPILVLPGLFQSMACWRPFTSMLAHRGWEVYSLARQALDSEGDGPSGGSDDDWERVVETASRAARKLGEKLILFGADIGASVALRVAETTRPMAMALFAPAAPGHAAAAYEGQLGFFERRRKQPASPVEAPARIRQAAPLPDLVAAEPRALLDSLAGARAADSRADEQAAPPCIVFGVADDPLVASDHAACFVRDTHTRIARTTVNGRWWPTTDWQSACDEAHRFLILTLGDRVVEFPEEILAD